LAGLAQATLGARDKAIGDYSEATRRNPDFAIAFHNRGYEFEIQGKTEEAMIDYKRALELSPTLKPASEDDAVNDSVASPLLRSHVHHCLCGHAHRSAEMRTSILR